MREIYTRNARVAYVVIGKNTLYTHPYSTDWLTNKFLNYRQLEVL